MGLAKLLIDRRKTTCHFEDVWDKKPKALSKCWTSGDTKLGESPNV